jgi:hypothetical protein
MTKVIHSLAELQRTAEKRGGKCLATEYVGMLAKYTWECEKGHHWTTTANSIRNGTWCPHCANEERRAVTGTTLADLKATAKERSGKCLSRKFKGVTAKYRWQCEHGHKWTARYSSIRDGSWCLLCAKSHEVLTIEDLQQTAKSRLGSCLSPEYLGYHAKHLWRCSAGHIWRARAGAVRYGSWCPKCNQVKEYTIAEINKMAERRGGKCLEGEYLGPRRLHLFICEKQHAFKETPSHVRRGRWCPKCVKSKKKGG